MPTALSRYNNGSMQSPFPGLDPYLEQYWQDVHASLIIYARDQLEELLPASLIARVEERVVLETDEPAVRSVCPEVAVVGHRRARFGREQALAERSSGGTAVVEPVIVRFRAEPATETCINIQEAGADNKLVTVIELLSRSNKFAGDGQIQYRRKQRELRTKQVSLVEIDLLRAGRRVFSVPVTHMPRHTLTTYQACVHRGWQDEEHEIYPVPLRRPLPPINIPLRQTDRDIPLNLQAILDLAYRKGRYGVTIDYSVPPDPPLRGDDARWAKALIRKARKA